ncbi:hypothetical protein J32TS6_40760 [Virgibacillus pantothenticus]|uniref:hypothetical protein n=1 Tax=unclassified Virgibacillus TaxID=2620237 RepID=UPI00090BEFD0|nr:MULTISPECIES: hypothetical protein [unclassified Virgibacillus]API91702.1 hypothetical protein BKP57_07595 [Virgibacillus sp. 6R]MBS7427816.1 hypothetical protein [Virgibacillus sp. 19R1-5]GIP65521.1 hypothetical protein J32TS6_40760 [Virgibacillus pantothenticus]
MKLKRKNNKSLLLKVLNSLITKAFKSFNDAQTAIKAGYVCAHVVGSRLLEKAKAASEIRKIKGGMQ